MKNKKLISKLGYSDGSPFKDEPYLDIHTSNGKIDMSNTGIPLWANGRILPPYSGIHHFDTDIVREIPLPKAQSLGEIKDRLSNYLSGNEGLLPGNQTSIKQSVKDRLYNSVTPIAYDPKHAMKEFVAGKQLPFMWDGKETSFDEFQNQPMFRGDTEYGEYSKNASMDAWGNYLGKPQKYDTFKQSSYQPGSFSFNNDDDIWDDVLHLDIINKLKEGQDEQVYDSAAGGFSLNNYILKKELDKDIDMPYVSYRDKNDYNVKLGPFNIEGESIVGNPFNVYGRMYYDPETNERLSEEDIYKLKLDKSRNRNLQKQEGGEYEELELTDEEIEEYKKGGYVVEKLPSYQTYGEVQQRLKLEEELELFGDSLGLVDNQAILIQQYLSQFPDPIEESYNTDFNFLKAFKENAEKAKNNPYKTFIEPFTNKFTPRKKEDVRYIDASNPSSEWNKIYPNGNTVLEQLQLNINRDSDGADMINILNPGEFKKNSDVNTLNTDNTTHLNLDKSEQISDKLSIKNRTPVIMQREKTDWFGNQQTPETVVSLPPVTSVMHEDIKPVGWSTFNAGIPRATFPNNKTYDPNTNARVNGKFRPMGQRVNYDPNSYLGGYDDKNFYNFQFPKYKMPTRFTREEYYKLKKEVAKKRREQIRKAEFRDDEKTQSKKVTSKKTKNIIEEEPIVEVKKTEEPITKKEVIKKPEIPKGYALSKGYQRDGVSYGDMWHDIESTRPAISAGPTMNDYYAKYSKSSDIADDDDLKLGGELPKAHEGGNFGEHKHPHMNMNIPLNHNGPATLEEKFTNEKQNWNNYLSHPFYQQNAKTTWGDDAAVNIQNQRDRINNTNIIYDNFSNDMHGSLGLYSAPNIEGEPGEIKMRDDLGLQNELHTIGHEVGHSTDVSPETLEGSNYQKAMYPEFSDYENLNLDYDIQFYGTKEEDEKWKKYQETPTEFRTRLNHVKSLMTENNFNWNEKSGEEINNWIEENNLNFRNPLSLDKNALGELNDLSRFNKIEKNQYSDYLGDEYRNYIDKDWRKAQGYNRFKKTWRKGIRTPEEWWNEYKGDNWKDDKEEFFKDRDGDGKPDMKMLLPEKKSIQDPKFLEHVFKRLAQQKNTSNEGNVPTAQSGGTVSQLWKQATGTPWSEAKKQGLTNGSYANNIALRKRIISGEFNSVPSQTSSRYIKEDFDYEKYGENIKRLLEEGNTLDDLVRKRIGTRAGLTNMFPELFDMPQMPEIPEQTFEPLTQNLPKQVVEEEDVEVSNNPTVNVPDWISNSAYTPPLTSNTQVEETQEEPAEIPSWINQSPFQIDPNYVLPESKSVEEEPAEIPSWISQSPVQIDPDYAFPDKNKKQDGLKSFLSQFENDEEVLDNEQRQSINLSIDQEKDKQKKAELIQQKEKEYLEQLKIEEQQRIDDYKNEILIQYGKDKISDLKQVGKNVYEEAVSNINEIKNEFNFLKNNIYDNINRGAVKYLNKDVYNTEKVDVKIDLSETEPNETYNDFTNPYTKKTFNLNRAPYKDLYAKEELKQVKTIREVADETARKDLKEGSKFKKLGSVKDYTGNIMMYQNEFDAKDGFNYVPIKNYSKSDKNTSYNNVEGIAHFLLDSDATDGYKHEYAKKMINQQLSGEPIISGSSVKDFYFPVYETLDNGQVNVKYLKKNEIQDLDSIMSPLRQFKWSDLDWEGKTNSAGFQNTVSSIPTKNQYTITNKNGKKVKTNKTHLIFPTSDSRGGKGAYGRFGGTGVVFFIELPNDERKIIEVAGSINMIKDKAKSIMKKYNLKPNELTFGYHDVGSFSARPESNKSKTLKFNQWSGYNKANNSWVGGALAFPSKNKKLGGEINQFELGGQYIDLDLTEEEIKEYQKGGFVVEDLPEYQAPPGQVISSTYSEYPFQIPEIVDTNLNDTITPFSNKKRFNSYTITGDPNKPHRRSASNIIYDMFHKPGSSEIKHDFNFKDGGENKYQTPPGEVRELFNSLSNTYPEKGNPAIDMLDLDVFGTLNEFFVEPAKRVIQDPIGTVKSIGNTVADVASFFNPLSVGSAEPLIESMVNKDVDFGGDGNNAFGTPYWTDNALALDAAVVAPVLGSTFKALKTLPNKFPNAYKYNPWAAKEATEKMLVRARPVGQDPYVNMAENLRAKQAAGEELKWYQKNLLNPQTNPDMKAREKYFGQWFADNPSNLDYYINPATRNFSDNAQIEILKAQMPKELASKYSVKNFEDAKRLSNLPNSEYILPKDMIQKLEKYSLKDLPILQAEFNELNTPHWLKGYKPVEKPLSKTLPGSPNTNVFTPDPTKFYRGIGKEGYDDALTTGMFRQAQSHEAMPGISKHRGVHYGAGKEGFETASSYDSDYIVELSKDSFLETPTTAGYLGKPVVATGEHVPLNKGRILKKDKNGNYKEITKEQLEKDQLSKIPKTTKGPLSQSVLDAFLKGENKISKHQKAPGQVSSYGLHDPIDATNDWQVKREADGIDPEVQKRIDDYYYSIPRVVKDMNKQTAGMAEFTGIPSALRVIDHPKQIAKDVVNTAVDIGALLKKEINPFDFNSADKNILGNPYGSGIEGATDAMIMAPLIKPAGNVLKGAKNIIPKLTNPLNKTLKQTQIIDDIVVPQIQQKPTKSFFHGNNAYNQNIDEQLALANKEIEAKNLELKKLKNNKNKGIRDQYKDVQYNELLTSIEPLENVDEYIKPLIENFNNPAAREKLVNLGIKDPDDFMSYLMNEVQYTNIPVRKAFAGKLAKGNVDNVDDLLNLGIDKHNKVFSHVPNPTSTVGDHEIGHLMQLYMEKRGLIKNRSTDFDRIASKFFRENKRTDDFIGTNELEKYQYTQKDYGPNRKNLLLPEDRYNVELSDLQDDLAGAKRNLEFDKQWGGSDEKFVKSLNDHVEEATRNLDNFKKRFPNQDAHIDKTSLQLEPLAMLRELRNELYQSGAIKNFQDPIDDKILMNFWRSDNGKQNRILSFLQPSKKGRSGIVDLINKTPIVAGAIGTGTILSQEEDGGEIGYKSEEEIRDLINQGYDIEYLD